MIPRCTLQLPPEVGQAVAILRDEWHRDGGIARLWACDAALWTNRNEYLWLDWLAAPERELARLDFYARLAADARQGGFRDALLVGMGGSSLAPEVLAGTFGAVAGHPALRVLDSTDPGEVAAVDRGTVAGRRLVIVSSRSGTTLETELLRAYFQAREAAVDGARAAGARFVAVTDPESPLEALARAAGYRRVVHGVPGIGGRFSALSPFGLAPAAIAGIDVRPLLERAQEMAAACRPGGPIADNPGFELGAALGAAARLGRDKLTLVASPRFGLLGAWIEQLVAESTGKQGKGIVPVDGEPPLAPEAYGDDRVFVYLRSVGLPDAAQDVLVAALAARGHPVVRIDLRNAFDLGAEFYRWSFATAVACSVLGVNPFNQPDVEASKAATRRLMTQDAPGPADMDFPLICTQGDLEVRADAANGAALVDPSAEPPPLAALLAAHFGRARPGDYAALLAYLPRNRALESQLAALRGAIAAKYGIATCAGFGPRFLHSTGQLHKGGANRGVFIQITADHAADIAVPGTGHTFGQVQAAQAVGDLAVLAQRERRLLWIHLGPGAKPGDIAAALA